MKLLPRRSRSSSRVSGVRLRAAESPRAAGTTLPGGCRGREALSRRPPPGRRCVSKPRTRRLSPRLPQRLSEESGPWRSPPGCSVLPVQEGPGAAPPAVQLQDAAATHAHGLLPEAFHGRPLGGSPVQRDGGPRAVGAALRADVQLPAVVDEDVAGPQGDGRPVGAVGEHQLPCVARGAEGPGARTAGPGGAGRHGRVIPRSTRAPGRAAAPLTSVADDERSARRRSSRGAGPPHGPARRLSELGRHRARCGATSGLGPARDGQGQRRRGQRGEGARRERYRPDAAADRCSTTRPAAAPGPGPSPGPGPERRAGGATAPRGSPRSAPGPGGPAAATCSPGPPPPATRVQKAHCALDVFWFRWDFCFFFFLFPPFT